MRALHRLLLVLTCLLALPGCPAMLAAGALSSPPPVKLGITGNTYQAPAYGWITLQGTATGTATTVVPAWVTSTSYSSGAVVQPGAGNVCLCTHAGTSASSGSGPTTTGTGLADGTNTLWSCWPPTGFRGIVIGNTDSSNALIVGGSTVTATGNTGGWVIPAGGALQLPAGLNFASVYWLTGGSSVVGNAAISN